MIRDEVSEPGGIPIHTIPGWRESPGVVAGITGRAGEFNLGFATPEPSGHVLDRWRRLMREFPDFDRFALGIQVHGSRVAVHGPGHAGLLITDGVDGHVTSEPGLLLAATVADCVPVYLAHPDGRAVGLLHAGWRGIASGILESGLTTFSRAASVSVENIIIHCGISICGACYEVGSEVISAVNGIRVDRAQHLDLRAALVERARRLGLDRISVSSLCSAHQGDRFFSHRASGGRDGRMVAFIGRMGPR